MDRTGESYDIKGNRSYLMKILIQYLEKIGNVDTFKGYSESEQ